MAYASVRGARLHYERAGSGEPLLFITGFAISARIFDPVLPLYAERFGTITYDNRGAGRSSAPWRPTSIPELAGDAVALLDDLGLDSAHVYGLSMGGMVAQELALRFPHRVRGLVLGATTPGGPRSVPPEVRELAALAVQRTPASAQTRARVVGRALFTDAFRAEHPDRVLAYLSLLGAERATGRGALAHLVASAYHDTTSRLARLQAPTLVLHGAQDRLTPPANARLLAGLIPDAELALVADAAHAYLLERPEESARLFTEWVDRRSPAAGRPLAGVAAAVEPVTRVLGLPTGALRAGRSLVEVAARTVLRRP